MLTDGIVMTHLLTYVSTENPFMMDKIHRFKDYVMGDEQMKIMRIMNF